jgi:hypothetical protein
VTIAVPTAEHRAILRYLTSERDHIREIINGLPEDDLRLPRVPSGWPIMALIQHLTWDMDFFWFRCVIAGDLEALAQLDSRPNAWIYDPATPTDVIFTAWENGIEAANEIFLGTDLDAAPGWWPREAFGEWRLDTNREVLMHVLAETSCHAGHLDIVREFIDGRQFLVLE